MKIAHITSVRGISGRNVRVKNSQGSTYTSSCMEFDIDLGILDGYVDKGLEESRTRSKTLFTFLIMIITFSYLRCGCDNPTAQGSLPKNHSSAGM